MNRNLLFYIQFNKNKGYCLLTKSFIPKNTIIYDPLKDSNVGILDNNDLESLIKFNYKNYPNIYKSLQYKLEYGYIINNKLYYPHNKIDTNTFFTIDSCNHKIWFINHSKNFNVLCNNNTKGQVISIRDINKDEEILEDYSNYQNNKIYDILCHRILGFKYSDIIKNWD